MRISGAVVVFKPSRLSARNEFDALNLILRIEPESVSLAPSYSQYRILNGTGKIQAALRALGKAYTECNPVGLLEVSTELLLSE